jgi:chromosome segregation ATPase
MSDIAKPTYEELEAQLGLIKKAQAGADAKATKYQAQIRDMEARLNKYRAMGDEHTLIQRIQRAEEAFKAKEAELETRYYARERALVAGIDYSLIEDYPFQDAAAVDAKIAALSTFIQDAKQRGVNEKLLSAPKPMAGGEPGSYKRQDPGVSKPDLAAYPDLGRELEEVSKILG